MVAKIRESELSIGVKRLRSVVMVMGVILFLGIAALFTAVYFKFMNKPNDVLDTASSPIQVKRSLVTPEACEFKAEATIEMEGTVISSSINGNILTIINEKKPEPVLVNKVQMGNSLTLTAAAGERSHQIIIFDLCKGIVLSKINIK